MRRPFPVVTCDGLGFGSALIPTSLVGNSLIASGLVDGSGVLAVYVHTSQTGE